MNKHNNVYIVLFGNDRFAPDRHFDSCKHKFDYLKDARNYAKDYYNAYIFKCHLNSSLLVWLQEMR